MRRRINRAIDSFESFHDYPYRNIGELGLRAIPEVVYVAGACRWVTYRSNKWNDGTHEYIHEIDSHPRVVLAYAKPMELEVGDDRIVETARRRLPARVRADNQVLSRIGKCLGWAFTIDDDQFEADAPSKTDWWWSPSGKALFAIEDMRTLHVVVWGGRLDVEDRGIVG